jgi:glycosyltransferase involved in cell wall biosynthesis
VGGEERSVGLHADALAAAGIPHRLLERDSAATSQARAAASLLTGGAHPGEVEQAARDLDATVVHFHSFQPLFGARAMAAAREAGARVVVHLHNFRLFCAISVAFRDGAPCFRCRGRLTLPGVALNCRGSMPEAVVYGVGLAKQQPAIVDAADRFIAPSGFAAGQLATLGLPAGSIEAIPHYLPGLGRAASAAGEGAYAVAAGRFAPEKGFEVAIDAAAASRVPLKLAGAGPSEAALRRRAEASGAPVEFAGVLPRTELDALMEGAAMAVVPTVGSESFGFAALEAMGAAVPVVATRSGALPELVGAERCVPRGDAAALADRMRSLWDSPERRREEGSALAARAASEYSRERFTERLLGLYERL